MFKIIYLKKFISMMQNQFAILQIVNKNLIVYKVDNVKN
jgi:hypothetical protein